MKYIQIQIHDNLYYKSPNKLFQTKQTNKKLENKIAKKKLALCRK